MPRAAAAAKIAAVPPPSRPAGDSRSRLLDAALALFCARGYFAVSVEDLAAAAEVSRMTFYRQFKGKAELAAELFLDVAAKAMPRLLAITGRDWRDEDVVRAWIAELFAADRSQRRLLRAFLQASADEDGFAGRAHGLIEDWIAGLGRAIPAFAFAADHGASRRRWLEAWMLLYEILDTSNHAARNSGIANDPQVIDILADRFRALVDHDWQS